MIEKPSLHGFQLLALALRIAPAERREWFAAMAAEFDHVPVSAQGRFALGCLLAAIRERVLSPQCVNALARCLLIGGAVFWAALNLRFAGRMSVDGTVMLEALGYGTALIFAAAMNVCFRQSRSGSPCDTGLCPASGRAARITMISLS